MAKEKQMVTRSANFNPAEEVFCVDHGLLPTGTWNPPVRPGVWKCVSTGCDNESVHRKEYERHQKRVEGRSGV